TLRRVSNVLSEDKKQQVIALGRLGWSLRRIENATSVRRETAAAYLRAAGIAIRPPGGWGRSDPKPAIHVYTDSGAKPAIQVSTDSGARIEAGRPDVSPTASLCEPHRDFIEEALSNGRNAMAIWQDLVDRH